MPEVALFGTASYPGVESVIDAQYTLSLGITPGRAILTIVPQDVSEIQGTGDLVLSDGLNPPVTLKDCQVVDLMAPQGDAGPLTLAILDGRWRWDFGEVSARWNVLFERSSTVPPVNQPLFPQGNQPAPPPPEAKGEEAILDGTRMVAPDLAKILLRAMKVKNYDLSGLDPKATPTTTWDCTNPAQALQQLASDLGCVLAYNPSDGSVAIRKQGDGGPLPQSNVLIDAPQLKAKPRPEKIRLRGAPDRVQMRIPLTAGAVDFDGSVCALSAVSYRPPNGDWTALRPPFDGLRAITGLTLPGKRKIDDAIHLAASSVYRYYLPCFWDNPAAVGIKGDLPDGIDLLNPVWDILQKQIDPKQKNLTATGSTLTFSDTGGEIYWRGKDSKSPKVKSLLWAVPRMLSVKNNKILDDLKRPSLEPAKCYGRHTPPQQCDLQNDILNASFDTTAETEVKVPFAVVNIGNDQQAVVFSRYVYDFDRDGTYNPADLVIECAVEIRYRSYQFYRTGWDRKLANTPPGTTAVIVRNDVRYQQTVMYNPGNKFASLVNNNDGNAVKKRADYYLNGEARKYELESAEDASYAGILPIATDGAIQQVTWSISPPTTRASMNTEHALYLPSFEERRQAEVVNLETQRKLTGDVNAILERPRGLDRVV